MESLPELAAHGFLANQLEIQTELAPHPDGLVLYLPVGSTVLLLCQEGAVFPKTLPAPQLPFLLYLRRSGCVCVSLRLIKCVPNKDLG